MVNNVLSSLIEIIRELDKKSPIYSYTIYIYTTITSPILNYMYCLGFIDNTYESTIPLP